MPLDTIVDRPQAAAEVDPRVARRRDRYAAQRLLWSETNLQRVAYCGRFEHGRGPAGVAVRVAGNGADTRAGLAGLQTCGSVWACPVCAEKIQAARQSDLEAGVQRWLELGKAVLFGTLTLSHHAGQRLEHLLDSIGPAWNRTTSGAGAQWNGTKPKKDGTRTTIGDRDYFGIAGYVRLLEIKHGENGWHPHIHFLLFLEEPLEEAAIRDLEGRLYGRWEGALGQAGLRCLREYAIDLQPVWSASDMSAYFSKMGNVPTAGRVAYEVTSSQSKKRSKGGRTPFEILADLGRSGDEDDHALWLEYEHASRGRRQLTWSRGLRKLLQLDVEKTDEEIAEEELEGETLFAFTSEEWRDGGWCYRREELLEAAETGPARLLELVRGVLADRSDLDRARTSRHRGG